MTTVVYVHGTGVREPAYSDAFKVVTQAIRAARPDVNVTRCFWGEQFGAKFQAQGVSIPNYETTRSLGAVTDEEQALALWEQLYNDPLYELRALALRDRRNAEFVPGQASPLAVMDQRVSQLFALPEVQAKLVEVGMADVADAARTSVVRSSPYREVLQVAPLDLSGYGDVVARAIIASGMAQLQAAQRYALILYNADLRDGLVDLLSQALVPDSRSIGGWIGKHVYNLALSLGAMRAVERRRGALTDVAAPGVGDILLYQARGEQIRQFIRETVIQAAGPVVVLAHSLGGIACVDLLVHEALPMVKLLITAGSQAPFLYEIGALQSLAFGEQLPAHFPAYLNIYDDQDFLSYVGAELFPGRVEDVRCNSRQPFPQAHSAYWANPQTWATILTRLP